MQKKRLNYPWGIKFMVFALLVFFSSGTLLGARSEEYEKTKVTLKVENMNLTSVLDTLATMTDVKFFYDHRQLDINKKVTLNVRNQSLEQVLHLILDDQAISFEFQANRVIVLKPRPKSAAIGLKMNGVVLDAVTNKTLPGASVVMKENTSIGVVSDLDGKFSLEIPDGISAILVSFIGYDTETYSLSGNLKDVVIKLNPRVEELQDVVVTGMAPRKVEGFSGSYVSVKGEELKKLNPTNILKALQVFDPSFRIVENNEVGSDPNALPEFRLRGDVQLGTSDPTSFQMMMGDYSNRPNMPLFILDGFKTTLQRIVDLDPERIESVTILKDAAATAIYGSEAANGVLVFETKAPLPGALNVSYAMNMGITAPDLSDYNLMNASEKLEYEKRAGLFNPAKADDMNYYNYYKAEILRGVDTYWLSEPLRTPVTQNHTLSLEGGDEALRYNFSLNYNSSPGVMKSSDRTTMGLNLNLQYRRKKWNIGNQLSLSNTEGNNSPYGSFTQYTRLNPYYRKTDENGNYVRLIERKKVGVGTDQVSIIHY